MAEIKISHIELMTKGAKATAPAKVVIIKSILNNLRTYILNSFS